MVIARPAAVLTTEPQQLRIYDDRKTKSATARTAPATIVARVRTMEKGVSGPLRRFWRPAMSALTETKRPEADFTALAVVVFGRDEAGKPHASSLGTSEAELAEKAAGLMGMRVLRLTSDEERELAAKLPRGRVFGSGRAFVPFVKVGLFDRLEALAQALGGPMAAGAASASQPRQARLLALYGPLGAKAVEAQPSRRPVTGNRRPPGMRSPWAASCWPRSPRSRVGGRRSWSRSRATSSHSNGATTPTTRRSSGGASTWRCSTPTARPEAKILLGLAWLARAGPGDSERHTMTKDAGSTGSDPWASAAKVRHLNDALRTSGRGGRIVVTAGIAALPPEQVAAILAAVTGFDAFNADNDPYGERDCACLTAAGHEVI